MTLLREGLLQGRAVALTGAKRTDSELARALEQAGAELTSPGEPAASALVHDARKAFLDDGLAPALADTWGAIVKTVNAALIPRGQGKVVLIAPPPASKHATAVRAALENLARTLSVEWARYGITTVALTPGASTTESDLSTLTCFLLSRAGDYYSGARFDLGAISAA